MYYNLHCHSVYSKQDALSEPIDIALRNKEMGNDAFCITDHGHLGAWIQAYMAQDSTGLQFIPGCEFYLKPEEEYWEWNKKHNKEIAVKDFATRYHHLVVLAKNQKGVKSLIRLYNSQEKYWNDKKQEYVCYYDKPLITRENLFNNAGDLIVLTACIAGEIPYYIMHGEVNKAKEVMQLYKNTFQDDYYIEIQFHHLQKTLIPEKELYNTLVKLARELEIEMVPTTDSHFNTAEDAKDHDIYKSIFWQNKKDTRYDFEVDQFVQGFDGEGYYIKNEKEIKRSISNIPELSEEDVNHIVENSVVIRNKCEKTEFPKAKGLVDKSKELRELVEQGFKERRQGTELEKIARERVEFELKTIENMGFTEYFINVHSIVQRAKELGLLSGAARGSAAGCEVCYLTHITEIDPIKNDLMFERFLNPSRFNYPDIDLDIQSATDKKGYTGKDIVIESLSEDVFPFSGQIVNESRCTTITLFKRLADTMGIKFNDANKLSTDSEVANNYLMEEEYTGWLQEQMQIIGINWTPVWDRFEKYLPFCYKYGGNGRGDKAHGLLWNTSIHASGVIFYPYDDKNVLPKSNQGVIYRGHDLEKMGYIKYDILSLDALNQINYFKDKIERDLGKPFDWEDCNDPETWETFQKADTDFVFQFASPGMKRVLRIVKPDSIDKLAELNSLYRPGCIKAGILDRYLADDWTEEEKVVGKFLKEEFGEQHSYAMIFQEDIMKVVEKMAGFSLADADLVRRAMQRKEKDTMDSYKEQFLKGFNREKYGNIAETVWETIEAFATYTFNKSHSVAYGCTAYWTAYIFTHYQDEYLEYLLNAGKQKSEVLRYLSKTKNIIYPSLATKNTEFVVSKKEVLIPTVSVQEDVSIGEYLMNLNADKNKMIVKFGIFDDYCVDRKGLRELFKSLNKKKIKELTPVEIQCIYNSKNINVLLNKLSAVGLIEFEKKYYGYEIDIQRARSSVHMVLRTQPDKEILHHNCQEDVRAYGLVRSLYCDDAPYIPTEEVADAFARGNSPTGDNRRLLQKIANLIPDARKINDQNTWFRVVCTKSTLMNWPKADIVFANGSNQIRINRKLVPVFKSFNRNEPILVRFALSFYVNKDREVTPSLEIAEVALRDKE